MLEDIGAKLQKLPRQFVWVRDLEYFEGPILSELKADGGVYLEKWCARDEVATRTLVVRTDQRSLAEYLAGRKTLRELLTVVSDDAGFILDRRPSGEICCYLVTVSDLPTRYLPQASAVHDPTLRPQGELETQNFLLDKDWDAYTLARIEREYFNAYSFCYLTSNSQVRRIPSTLQTFIYEGGYVFANAFRRMRASVRKEDRPRAVGVSASSPGVLLIEAPTRSSQLLAEAVVAAASASALEVYREVHKWSRLKLDRETEVPDDAQGSLEDLCKVIMVDLRAVLPDSPDGIGQHELLVAGKLVASYFRRLRYLGTSKKVEYLIPGLERNVDAEGEFEDSDDEGDDLLE